MPQLPKLDLHTFSRLVFWLARIQVALSLLCPVSILSAIATAFVYLYLQYEHLFNSSLVRKTPAGDETLPTVSEWVANGGLRKDVPPRSDSDSDDETCIVCLDPPTKPVQITACGHIYCMGCLKAWIAKGNRSCPLCTTKLWRPEKVDRSHMEKMVKATAAEMIVAVPLTIYNLYVCSGYYLFNFPYRIGSLIGSFQMFLFVGSVLLSIVVLALVWQGMSTMIEMRRTCGLKWWGADMDVDVEPGFRMATCGCSAVGAWWLASVSLGIASHADWPIYLPFIYHLIMAGILFRVVDQPAAFFRIERDAEKARDAERTQDDERLRRDTTLDEE